MRNHAGASHIGLAAEAVALKSEARRPRAERRLSSEIRSPKPEAEVDSGFDLRPSAFGFDPRRYKQDAPNGAFRTPPFSVPIGIAARLARSRPALYKAAKDGLRPPPFLFFSTG